MDERRLRLYVSIIVGLFLLAGGRIALESNPVYEALEPVLAKLDSFASEVALVDDEAASANTSLSNQNELLEAENERLRSELGVKLERKTQPAEVTRRELTGFAKAVWVNAGQLDGVAVGQTVVHKGTLFGEVEEVYDSTARVRTVLDPDFRATVVIDDQQGVLKVVHGSLIVDLVPTKMLAGRPVKTDGLDNQLEANLYIGTTDEEIASDSDVFGAYNILLPYSVFDVRFVEIIQAEVQE